MSDTVQSVIDRFVADLRSAMVTDVAAALGGVKRESPVKARAEAPKAKKSRRPARGMMTLDEAKTCVFAHLSSGFSTRAEVMGHSNLTRSQWERAIGALTQGHQVRRTGDKRGTRYEVVR